MKPNSALEMPQVETLEKNLEDLRVNLKINEMALSNANRELTKALSDNQNPTAVIKKERDELKAYQATKLKEKDDEIKALKEEIERLKRG